jgi:hypothetical protein
MGRVNDVGDEHYYWTCPECGVTFINSTYCYKCDILGDESEAKQIEKEEDEES